jgi:hypothetical protein
MVPSGHPRPMATSGSTSTVSPSAPAPIPARELAAARPDHPRYAALGATLEDEAMRGERPCGRYAH